MQTEFRQGHSRVCNNQQSLHLIHFNVRAWQVGLNESRLQMKGWCETRRLIDDWGSLISGWAPNMLYNSGRYIVVWTCGWELTLRWHRPGTHVVCMCVYICVHGYNLSIITCMSVCSPVTSKRGLIHRSRQCVCVFVCAHARMASLLIHRFVHGSVLGQSVLIRGQYCISFPLAENSMFKEVKWSPNKLRIKFASEQVPHERNQWCRISNDDYWS